MGGVAGHAGMFSDIEDMTRYALALRYPETAKHLQIPPLLSHLTRPLTQENQIEPSIGGHSIGWFTPPNGMLPRGDILSAKSFGHTGFTGTMLMFDIPSDLTLLLFTNRVYYPGENPESLRIRRLFANAVAGAVRL
jgi:CubicO group peptidase (beta-lactamase class C family)